MGIDWNTDCLDYGKHLNFSGAIKRSAVLGQYLNARYHLPDRKHDVDYRSWERMEKQYRMHKNKTLKKASYSTTQAQNI